MITCAVTRRRDRSLDRGHDVARQNQRGRTSAHGRNGRVLRRGPAHGADVDDLGFGTVTQQRLHQLIRQPGRITDRTFEITFLDPDVQAYAFTFG